MSNCTKYNKLRSTYQNNNKNLNICYGFTLIMLLIVMVIGMLIYYSAFMRLGKLGKLTGELEAGVLVGSDFLSKKIFFKDEQIGNITDIVFGELDTSPGMEIGIAGYYGACFLNAESKVKSSMMFKLKDIVSLRKADEYKNIPSIALFDINIDIVDVEMDGICEFMKRGGFSSDACLIDHNGNIIWTCKERNSRVQDMCAGDIDGDGNLEFVAGFLNWGGIQLLDKNGKRIWKKGEEGVWRVGFVDVNNDGRLEIVHAFINNRIKV